MVIALRIYRTHDPDLYSMFLTIGRKLFKAVVKDALHVVLLNAPRATGKLLVQDVSFFQVHLDKVLRVSINIDEDLDPEIVNILSKMKPNKTGLFVKQVIRRVFLEDMISIYATENIKLYTASEPMQQKYAASVVPATPKVKKHTVQKKSSTLNRETAPVSESQMARPEEVSEQPVQAVEESKPISNPESSIEAKKETAPTQGIMDLMKLAEALQIE